MFTKTKNVLAD